MTSSAPGNLEHLLAGAFTSNDLADLCAAHGLPIAGSKDERIHRLASARIESANLLEALTNDALAEACRSQGLPIGRKAEMIAALMGLSGTLAAEANVPPPELLEATRENVLRILGSKHVPRRTLQGEELVEHFVATLLAPYFKPIATQFFVGGHLGAKIDLDVGGRVGLELKLANSLTRASEAYRLLGQALHYRKRYGSDLIVGIAGLKSEHEEPLLVELRELLTSLGVTVAILEAL